MAITNAVHNATITNLLAHREEYKGKRVEVTGYYVSFFEYSALYVDSDERFPDRGLWIDFRVKPGHERAVNWSAKGTVRIVGRFEYRPRLGVGHLGGWPAKLTDLELFEEVR